MKLVAVYPNKSSYEDEDDSYPDIRRFGESFQTKHPGGPPCSR